MLFIIVLFPISLFNLSFLLILHVPSLSLVGPKILLNIFLSNTNLLGHTESTNSEADISGVRDETKECVKSRIYDHKMKPAEVNLRA